MNTNTVEILVENGFTVTETFTTKGSLEKLNAMQTISKQGVEILYIRENENGTYNTFGFLNHPTSFAKNLHGIDSNKLITILNSIEVA